MKFTRSKTYRILSIIPVLAIMVVIFYLSAQSGEESAETSGGLMDFLSCFFQNALVNNFIWDFVHEFIRTLAHFAEYALLGLLMYNAVYAFGVRRAPVISTAFSFAYALSDEIHQYFVPERSFQIIDLAVDLGGIISGTVIIILLFKLINKISLKDKKENVYD